MEKMFFSVRDVSDITGLSKSTIYKLTSTRAIPFHKPFGKKIFFKWEQIEEMLTRGRIKSIDEIVSEPLKKS